jgi:hypothetical protein
MCRGQLLKAQACECKLQNGKRCLKRKSASPLNWIKPVPQLPSLIFDLIDIGATDHLVLKNYAKSKCLAAYPLFVMRFQPIASVFPWVRQGYLPNHAPDIGMV